MDKNYLIIPGVAFLILGAIFLLGSSTGITGYVVAEKDTPAFGYYLGIVFALIGLALFLTGRRVYHNSIREKAETKLDRKTIEDLARQNYRINEGRNPTRIELKEYTRKLEQSGEIYDLFLEYRRRGRAA